MQVQDLIAILSKCGGELPVKGTWEGTEPEIDTIYIEDGVLYLDVDEGFYIRNHPSGTEEILYMAETTQEE